jgi:hypothetical protein
MSGKERAPNDPNSPFKEKEKEGGEGRSQFGGEWKVLMVALGRFHCLVAFERFYCLAAFGRFQCLVANGRRRKNTFSPPPTFPQTNYH